MSNLSTVCGHCGSQVHPLNGHLCSIATNHARVKRLSCRTTHHLACNCREERFKLLEESLTAVQLSHAKLELEIDRLRDALNRIGMLGHSEHAYTREFTEGVRSIVDSALSPK